jgi:F0F1-type ATP synthase membrane subunit b/b'
MLDFDGTFFAQLINFAIFFAVLYVVFLKPVSKAITARREYITSVTTDYDRYQAEGQQFRQEAEALRAAARRDAEQTIATARAATSNESAALSSDYGAQVQAKVEEAQRTALAELEAARDGEGDRVKQLAALMVDRTVPGSTR